LCSSSCTNITSVDGALDSTLTPENSLLKSCFDYKIPNHADKNTPQQLTDAMIDGMGINMLANRFTISGFPQWYPFGVPGVNYQQQDETMQFRFSIEER
jgi:hypothetical protein